MKWENYKNSIDMLPQNNDFVSETFMKVKAAKEHNVKPAYIGAVCVGTIAVAASAVIAIFVFTPPEITPLPIAGNSNQTQGNSANPNTAIQKSSDTQSTESKGMQQTDTTPSGSASQVYSYNVNVDSRYTPDLGKIIKDSEVVIQGRITDVSYLAVDGNAWSKVSIVIDQSLKGNVNQGQTITMYQMGGFISMKDHNAYYHDSERWGLSESELEEKIIKQTVNHEDLPEAGDENLYCLVLTPNGSPLPNGVYEELTIYGQLKVIDHGQKFVQTVTNEITNYYTMDDLKKLLG